MTTHFLTLFDRELGDHGDTYEPTTHFNLLVREFRMDTEFDETMFLMGGVLNPEADRMTLAVVILRATPCWTSLRDDLQKAFDEGAVEGNFTICGTVERALPIVVT